MTTLKTPGELKYDIHQLKTKIELDAILGKPNLKTMQSLKKKTEQLEKSEMRELRKLVKTLTYKADVYGPHGRIYSWENKWTVTPAGKLKHGEKEYDAEELTDGHGRKIRAHSNY
jgi:hypothetical protein